MYQHVGSCADLVPGILSRIAMFTEGYPTTHRMGTFVLDRDLWTRCGPVIEKELDGKTLTAPGLHYKAGSPSGGEWVQATFTLEPARLLTFRRRLFWSSNMKAEAFNRSIVVERFASKV